MSLKPEYQEPSYFELYHSGELRKRSGILVSMLSECRLCPRNCGVNRLAGQTGFCNSGPEAVVARYCVHRGEEPCLSGTTGVGNIFFANCNLRCVYCQNHQISQPAEKTWTTVTPGVLAGMMMELQDQDCSSVGFVTPAHFIPMIVQALLEAVPKGFRLPLIYNTNAYDSAETMEFLEGIIDIYLPDLKYAGEATAIRYSSAPHYADYSRRAVSEMYRQVGSVIHLNDEDVMSRGLMIRHLILPGYAAESRSVLEWIAGNISPRVTVSLMSQYYPAFRAPDFQEINRTINDREYEETVRVLKDLGFENFWLQHADSHQAYKPDFESAGHPFEQ